MPDIELNLDDLNPFEGDRSVLLAENEPGFWKGLIFDPTQTIAATTGFLVLQNNEIVLSTGGGGGGGLINLTGVITGSGPADGSPITTSFAAGPLNIPLGGGRITGLLGAPYALDEAVNKGDIDTWLTTTLSSANSYTDGEITAAKALDITATGDVTGVLRLDQSNALTIANKNITLTGDVTGTGLLGGSIATSLTLPIDAGGQPINGLPLTPPTLDSQAASKKYVDDTAAAGGAVTLTGAVTGSGSSPITTFLTSPAVLNGIQPTSSFAFDLSGIGGTPSIAKDIYSLSTDVSKSYIETISNNFTDIAGQRRWRNWYEFRSDEGEITLDYTNETGLSKDIIRFRVLTPVGGPASGVINLYGDVLVESGSNVSANEPPALGDHLTNKTYVDSAIGGDIIASGDVTGTLRVGETNSLTIANKNITLTGPVTGVGILGGSIATSLTLPIDAGSQKVLNVAIPTLNTDAANKAYVDSASGGGTLTLTGAVTGSGDISSPVTTFLANPAAINTIQPTSFFSFDLSGVIGTPSISKNIYSLSTDVSKTYIDALSQNFTDVGGQRRWRNWYEFRSDYSYVTMKYNNESGLSKDIVRFRVLTPAGGPASGVVNLYGNVYVESGSRVSANAAPSSGDHLTNKTYVDGILLAHQSKVDGLIKKLYDRIEMLEKLNGIKPSKKSSFLRKLFTFKRRK